MAAVKRCPRCLVEKPTGDFNKNKGAKDGLGYYCRSCASDYNRTRRTTYAIKERENKYLRAYGITTKQYDEMVMSQCGLCAVCGGIEKALDWRSGEPKRLAVHHDHQTGRVVALLCQDCNRGMGLLSDSPLNLRRAADLMEVAA